MDLLSPAISWGQQPREVLCVSVTGGGGMPAIALYTFTQGFRLAATLNFLHLR